EGEADGLPDGRRELVVRPQVDVILEPDERPDARTHRQVEAQVDRVAEWVRDQAAEQKRRREEEQPGDAVVAPEDPGRGVEKPTPPNGVDDSPSSSHVGTQVCTRLPNFARNTDSGRPWERPPTRPGWLLALEAVLLEDLDGALVRRGHRVLDRLALEHLAGHVGAD